MRCDEMSTIREPQPWRPHGFPEAVREADDRRLDDERREAEIEARTRLDAVDDRSLCGWV